MAKKKDVVLDEIDAFLEEETKPKKKRTKKEEVKVEEVEEPKKRGRKKKEVIEEVKEEVVTEVKEEPKEEKKPKKVKESKKVSQDEEDLYLTQSFKPIKTRRRLKKGVIKFFRNLIIFGLLGVLAYFGYLKVTEIYNMLKPVNVYKEVIKAFEDASIDLINNEIPKGDNFSVEVTVDTNMEGYTYFNGNKMAYNYNAISGGYEDLITVNDKGIYTLRNSEGTYVQYLGSDNMFEVVNRSSSKAEFVTSLLSARDNLDEIIKGNSDILIDILEEDDVKSNNEELSINDLDLDVKCHTVTLDDDLINRYLVELFKNDRLVNKMAEFSEEPVESFKTAYEKALLKLSNKVNINVYVYKFEFVGFDIEVDGFREAYVYTYKDDLDCKINGLYSVLGVEGIEADFRLSTKNQGDDVPLLLEDNDEELVYAYDNMKITVKGSDITYEYRKGDNFAIVNVVFKKGKEIGLNTDGLTTSLKVINKEHTNFEKQLNDDEALVYIVENNYLYGE